MTQTHDAAPMPIPTGNGLLDLMTELDHVLRAEEALLTQSRHQVQHKDLLAQKQQLVVRYTQTIRALAQEPERLREMSDSQRNALRQIGQRLEETTTRNMKLLKREISTSDFLLRTVVDTLRQQQPRAPGSGGYGGQSPAHIDSHDTTQPMLVRKKI